MVHFLADQKAVRRLSKRFNAFGVMTDRERSTYFNWLGMPHQIRGILESKFVTDRMRFRWGKIEYVGVSD